MNYDYIQKPDIDLLIHAALDAGATVSKSKSGEKGGIFINGRRLEDGELEDLLLNPKPLTNADRIRRMTDEELAKFVNDTDFDPIPPDKTCADCRFETCESCWLDWLKQELALPL